MENLSDEDLSESEFLNGLESALKALIAFMLSDLFSCSIHPKIKQDFATSGIVCPINTVDLKNMLDICPTSDEGRRIYNNISSGDTPSDLENAIDLNAFLWYVLYRGEGEPQT